MKFKDLAISLENSAVPRVTENYQLTTPEEIRNEILIEAGDEIEMMVNEKKEVIICKVKKGPVEDSFGIWTWTGEKSGISSNGLGKIPSPSTSNFGSK